MINKTRPYGVGLAYRPNVHYETMRHAHEIDVLEVNSVDYIDRYWRLMQDPDERLLREAVSTFPCVAHGINMSIGSVEPHDQLHLDQTRKFLEQYGINDFSEHTAFHRMDGNDVLSFIAMPFEEVSLRWLVHKYNAARESLGHSFGLENVSYYFLAPDCQYEEAEFLTELTRRTDCTIMLDVTNVFNNAYNHNYDPIEFIRRLPGDRIKQLHIAGGQKVKGIWLDSHSAPVMDGVWDLLHETLEHTAAETVFLERDSNYHPFEAIMPDVRTARSIFYEHRPDSPPDTPNTEAENQTPTENAEVDPKDPEFADLRSFQRAIMGQITDKDFRQEVTQDPSAVQKYYPMSPQWQQRWQGCSQEPIGLMAKKWPKTVQRNQEMKIELQQLDWGAWASQEASSQW